MAGLPLIFAYAIIDGYVRRKCVNLYYRSVMDEIHRLMDEENYRQAVDILKQELSMPYIPMDVQAQLETLYQSAAASMPESRPAISTRKLDDWIAGSEQQQMAAVHVLKDLNLRNMQPQVQALLHSNASSLVKGELIEALRQQKVDTEYEIDKNGLQISFIPSLLTDPADDGVLQQAYTYLQNWFSASRPDLEYFARSLLEQETLASRPMDFQGLSALDLAQSIVKHVYQALGQPEAYLQFLKEHHLEDGLHYILNIEE